MEKIEFKIIAHIHTEFPEKFGVPRQSNLVPELKGKIVFEPEFRDPKALDGLEEYEWLWLLWIFSKNPVSDKFSPLVRPPRLGGNVTKGVWGTRSPFRPNPIGLSSLKIERIVPDSPEGPLIYVSGVDMVDGTPIVDIKPYQTTSDCHEGAAFGFAQRIKDHSLTVEYDPAILNKLEELKSSGQFDSDRLSALNQLIANDPRPAYQDDPERMYGLSFSAFNFKFKVNGNIARIMDIEKL